MPSLHASLGELLPLWTVLPFAGMLLSIAVFPLVAPKFWHNHFGKVSAFWAVAIVVPLLIYYRGAALDEFLHVIFSDYFPFIILLGGLYTVSGGILLKGSIAGTPLVNTGMLLAGTLLASWMGTTGAAMLLIRPFLRANAKRKQKTFMPVFFIFLVANVGGALTPLGDPPLFLGFLKGVPFFWTMRLLPQMVLIAALLLVLYFFMDLHFYNREKDALPRTIEKEKIRIEGSYNFILLLFIIGAVLLSGVARWGEVSLLGIHRAVQDVVRDALIVLVAFASMWLTPRRLRDENEFTWFPLKEVAILFVAIFLTMVPALKILQAGPHGALAPVTAAITGPVHYFWATGAFSSFLDNAPTYLTFLNTAQGSLFPGEGGDQALKLIISENPIYLLAISAGAVFFGAFTYIGNAPNFMVRSISEESGTPMPGFFGYMIKYSIPVLVPVYILVTVIFFG